METLYRKDCKASTQKSELHAPQAKRLLCEKVGTNSFRCARCEQVMPLSKRHGRICHRCHYQKFTATQEGKLRFRFSMKKSVARRAGREFTLTFSEFKRLFTRSRLADEYTGEIVSIDLGRGKDRTTGCIDRLNNSKGYVQGNVALCGLGTNSRKNKWPVDKLHEKLDGMFDGEPIPQAPEPR